MPIKTLTLALVLATCASTLARQDTGTVSTIEFGSQLSLDGIVVGEDGTLYGAQGFDGFRIYELGLDGSSEQVVTSLSGPIDMDFDASGGLYVTTFNDRGLFLANPEDGSSERVATVDTGPSGIAIDRERNVGYVSHYGTGMFGNGMRIYAVDLATRERSVFANGGGLLGVVSLAVDDEGNLYAANIGNAKVFRISPEGVMTEIATLPTNPNATFNIGHVAWARGGLYVTGNGGMPHVYRVEPDGSFEIIAGSGEVGSDDGDALNSSFSGPNGIAASVTGDSLFVSELSNPRTIRVIALPPLETGSTIDGVLPSGFDLGSVYPNPLGQLDLRQVTIRLAVPGAEPYELRVFDMLGREHLTVHGRSAREGTETLVIDLSLLSSGMYLYSLESRGYRLTRRMVVAA